MGTETYNFNILSIIGNIHKQILIYTQNIIRKQTYMMISSHADQSRSAVSLLWPFGYALLDTSIKEFNPIPLELVCRQVTSHNVNKENE